MYWRAGASTADSSYKTFWKYLEMVFSYAGTASLEKELDKKSIEDIQIGDVFIQGGFPGHAIIVIDLCTNLKGEKMVMLAQSYMPAQEIQVLINPSNNELSPWFTTKSDQLVTPEWTFSISDLKSF